MQSVWWLKASYLTEITPEWDADRHVQKRVKDIQHMLVNVCRNNCVTPADALHFVNLSWFLLLHRKQQSMISLTMFETSAEVGRSVEPHLFMHDICFLSCIARDRKHCLDKHIILHWKSMFAGISAFGAAQLPAETNVCYRERSKPESHDYILAIHPLSFHTSIQAFSESFPYIHPRLFKV